MMLMTAKLVARETSKRFQFGFWQFEPLVLAVEGFFILLIVIYALSSGITDLLSGGRHVDFGPAIFYAIFFTVADLSLIHIWLLLLYMVVQRSKCIVDMRTGLILRL